jgi:hypothetical protein
VIPILSAITDKPVESMVTLEDLVEEAFSFVAVVESRARHASGY